MWKEVWTCQSERRKRYSLGVGDVEVGRDSLYSSTTYASGCKVQGHIADV